FSERRARRRFEVIATQIIATSIGIDQKRAQGGTAVEGERDLSTLIQRMTPAVHPEIFVFCSLPNCQLQPGLAPVGTFFEAEGLTVIVPLRQALDLKLKHQFESRMLT